jgi:predicted transcriptional regulator/rubrerythrin
MKDNNYITIQGWMVNQLKLSGNDLLVYAIIYGFSQDEESAFQGAMSYLAASVNASKRTVFDVLNRLVEKGLIVKKEFIKNGQKYCDYRTNPRQPALPKGRNKGSAESAYPMQNLHTPHAESAPHIDLYNTKDTAAADQEKPRQTEQTDSETAATAEELTFLKQTFRRLDASLIFDHAFYGKAAAFMKARRLDSGYLSWLYEFCARKKPRSIAGFYFKVFFEPRFVELYRASLPPPEQTLLCPVCGTEHGARDTCPVCALEPALLKDKEHIERLKKLRALPAKRRTAYEAELDSLCKHPPAKDSELKDYFRRVKALEQSYGL